jgi:hypothetical protein
MRAKMPRKMPNRITASLCRISLVTAKGYRTSILADSSRTVKPGVSIQTFVSAKLAVVELSQPQAIKVWSIRTRVF